MNKKIARCPCCDGEVIVEHKPAKWQGGKDRVIITHVKWQVNWS